MRRSSVRWRVRRGPVPAERERRALRLQVSPSATALHPGETKPVRNIACKDGRTGETQERPRLTMRTLFVAVSTALLAAVEAFAQPAQLAPVPTPVPFPQGSSVFQWDYQCIERKVCGFTGFGLERLSLQSASIVLAKLKVGEIEMPTYFIWCTLIDGSLVSAMVQDELLFRFSVVNMKLTAAGSPGL
jgi:hypothetical protein